MFLLLINYDVLFLQPNLIFVSSRQFTVCWKFTCFELIFYFVLFPRAEVQI